MQFSFSALLVFVVAAVSVQAAPVGTIEERGPVHPPVIITGPGATDVVGNKFGCAHIRPAGKAAQLVCTVDFTATGFTINVKDETTKAHSSCVITGTAGSCGPSGAGAKRA
ncbi:hypothetical protein GALMADRAFT_206010 [Galerina marginata CBS 339.88]|uniref:Pectate lyase n=1 Tax=Galerina marginata (strain CBS 339.88) TaxID=685588 RepID=A0A067TWK6_GALM3|nr:hypothetical protein GALMADRAFT_206010 [Galerina marginata CBS 339.88]